MLKAETSYSIAEAKNHLPLIVHKVEEGEVAYFSRRGKSVAVLISAAKYQQLATRKKSFSKALQEIRQELADKKLWLKEEEWKDLRAKDPGRQFSW